MAGSNPLFCRSGLWRAGQARGHGSRAPHRLLRRMSSGPDGVYTFIARNRAMSYVDRYDDKSPKEALGMFCSSIRRV